LLETFNTLVREMKKAGSSENPEKSGVHNKIKEFALLVNSIKKPTSKPASKPKEAKIKDSSLKKREKKSEKKVV
jgi:hypothetical protein